MKNKPQLNESKLNEILIFPTWILYVLCLLHLCFIYFKSTYHFLFLKPRISVFKPYLSLFLFTYQNCLFFF
ncbi:hypothetical protein BDF21DRAFT_416488 [Thamnidium elegans]|nr:hypothetical protein BDF21DRAFT_416488 [Thamnidium elegans]